MWKKFLPGLVVAPTLLTQRTVESVLFRTILFGVALLDAVFLFGLATSSFELGFDQLSRAAAAGFMTVWLTLFAFTADWVWIIKLTSIIGLPFIFFGDIAAKTSLSPRWWVFLVPLLDTNLTFDLPNSQIYTQVIATVIWLSLAAMDSATSGVALSIRDNAFNESYVRPAVCDCERPPCQTSVVSELYDVSLSITVLLLDFYLTRSFAVRMREQMDSVNACVRTAERLTVLLSRYEVDEAEMFLDVCSKSRCPPGLARAYRQLVHNLREYRLYLPMSVLEPGGRDESSESDEEAITPVTISRPASRSPSPKNAEPGDPIVIRHEPRPRTASLVCVNHRGLLQYMRSVTTSASAEWIDTATTRFISEARSVGGVVDLVSGDHCFASFNAACACHDHPARAVLFAHANTAPDQTLRASSSVVTGSALCGDFGVHYVRFMIVGHPQNLVTLMERVATTAGVAVLVDQAAHNIVSRTWRCRLRFLARYHKCTQAPIRMLEVVDQKPRLENQEWMYELADIAADPWDDFNQAMLSWSVGDGATARLQLAKLECQTGEFVGLADALQELRLHITAGVCATRELCEGGLSEANTAS